MTGVPARVPHAVPLTASEAEDYLPKLVWKRRRTMTRAGRHEADIQAPQPQAGEQARVPGSHEVGRRPQDAQPPQEEGQGRDRREGRREVVPDPAERGERLPRNARIRSGSEIRDLLKRGRRKRTSNVDVFCGASPASHSRFGLIVPKHGRRIVDRNVLKRRLREIGRRQILVDLNAAGLAVDVLVRARRSAYEVDFEGLSREVRDAVEALCSQDS